jgi:hypothetical protein
LPERASFSEFLTAVPVGVTILVALGATILGLTGQSGESRRQKALFYRLLHGLFTTSGGGAALFFSR